MYFTWAFFSFPLELSLHSGDQFSRDLASLGTMLYSSSRDLASIGSPFHLRAHFNRELASPGSFPLELLVTYSGAHFSRDINSPESLLQSGSLLNLGSCFIRELAPLSTMIHPRSQDFASIGNPSHLRAQLHSRACFTQRACFTRDHGSPQSSLHSRSYFNRELLSLESLLQSGACFVYLRPCLLERSLRLGTQTRMY